MGSDHQSSSLLQSLLTSGTGLLSNVLSNSGILGDSWSQLVAASVMPLVASVLWYAFRTVVEVTDTEQSKWLLLWLRTHGSAIQRARRLRLLSSFDNTNTSNTTFLPQRHGGNPGERSSTPPKLEFKPAINVSTWSLFGWWPISVKSSLDQIYDPSSNLTGIRPAVHTLTVWFAPWGTSIAKEVLLQGRQLWLDQVSKKTEIWMPDYSLGRPFAVQTRPSRPLSTVIVEKGIKQELIEDMKRFLGAESWYIDKGIPYRRGVLLYGSPGCGKTSLVTALAGALQLPIVFLQLNSDCMDDQRLMALMSAAPRDSIVLIEDIDCVFRDPSSPTVTTRPQMGRRQRESVTMSGLLNALDGVAAQEGRLLIMTTNHIDRLDDALIRPGRVDVKFHLKKASQSAAGELFDQFFASSPCHTKAIKANARSRFLALVEDGKHSFASLQGVLMLARDDPLSVEIRMRDILVKDSNDDEAVQIPEGGEEKKEAEEVAFGSTRDKALVGTTNEEEK